MQQITLTLDLTAENLEKLKAFCQDTGAAPAAKAAKAKTQKAAEAPAKAAEPETPAEPEVPFEEKPEQPAITMTDVRAVALKISKAGGSAKLKDIFAKFGAAKLSEVPAEKYGELMAELTAVNA